MAADTLRWSKFWWSDWHSDVALRCCSVAARGLWMEMLCIAATGEPRGYVTVGGKPASPKQIAAIAGVSIAECELLLIELEEAGVFSRNDDGCIYSRRMVRDTATSEGMREVSRRAGNPTIIRGTVPKSERVRPFKRSDAPLKAQRVFDRSGGCCHWCGTKLQQTARGPDFFEIDHVVAIRDGGTNDESNLVAACSVCNLRRSRHQPDHNPTEARPLSDRNHQEAEARSQKLEAEKNTSPTGDVSPPRAETPPLLDHDPFAERRPAMPIEAAVDAWNAVCGATLGRVAKITDLRRKHLRARLVEHWPDAPLDGWRAYCERILRSDFLTGRRGSSGAHAGWKADFDWACNAANAVKIIEGRYDNERGQPAPLPPGQWREAPGTI